MSSNGGCKCITLCALAGFGVFCLTMIFLTQWYGNPLKHQILSILAPGCPREGGIDLFERGASYNYDRTSLTEEIDAELSDEVKRVTDLERKIIRDDMGDYPYPNGKYNRSARKIEDLLIEENGNPIRNVILATWRSGSSFLGEILNAHPATFYHFEPLVNLDMVQIRGPPLAANALERVKTLLSCEYPEQGGYLKFLKFRPEFLHRNTRLWEQCEADEDPYYNHKFLSAMCKLFPFQLMKLVRLRLGVARELLAENKLAVRMVLLVRDPRGIIQSRKHLTRCTWSRDCSDPALLCADLASDYEIAVELLKTYPASFKVIRYEDLAAEPYERARELSEFYGLDFHENMKVFLETHTKRNSGGIYSTFRDSKTAAYHWRNELAFEEVEEIQRSCVVAMERWGYEPALNASHQTDFNPVTNYVLTNYRSD